MSRALIATGRATVRDLRGVALRAPEVEDLPDTLIAAFQNRPQR